MDAAIIDQRKNTAAEFLARTRELVGPLLRRQIDLTPEGLRRIVSYHLGLSDAHGQPVPGGAGKAIRPALVLAGCELAGGLAEDALPGAVAVEFVHNFTLLHDDVMDGDRTRRNRPTAWVVFGLADAILAGDALQAMAFQLLAEQGGRTGRAAAVRLAACMIELCEGQRKDCSFEGRQDVGVAECWSMAEGKTGALLGYSCALGALAAGADADVVDALDTWGRRMGRAFQLVDDLLGIWGDPAVTGKPAYSDFAARKKSLPIAVALTSGTEAGAALARLLGTTEPLTPARQEHAAELVEQAGGRRWARERISALLEEADGILDGVSGDAQRTAVLRALAEHIVRRDH